MTRWLRSRDRTEGGQPSLLTFPDQSEDRIRPQPLVLPFTILIRSPVRDCQPLGTPGRDCAHAKQDAAMLFILKT